MAVRFSIVVPVYKVEKYLRRCLDSLVSQNYDSKELLLIDDGSPDMSGEICDEYAAEYDFIRVIHQSNKGLAEVRNVGIKEAKGEFISFIDSDDYVLDGLYSYLDSIIRESNADIVCFGHVGIYDDKLDESYASKVKEEIVTFTGLEALDQLFFENYVDVITCNKVIKRELFDNITYPVGKLYEDMFTTYKYVAKAKVVTCTTRVFYIYCHRRESIGGQRYNEKTIDLAKAATETYKYSLQHCTKIENLHVGYVLWMTIVANIMIRSNHQDNLYFSEVRGLSKKYRKDIFLNKLLSKTRKVELFLIGFSFPLYKIIYQRYVKKHRFGQDK